MSALGIVTYLFAAGIAVIVVTGVLRLGWRLHGHWRIRRAGPRKLLASRHRIWREPSFAESADLRYGPGGPDTVPVAPFRFVEEHLTGSQPCVAGRDARDRVWRV